VSAVLCAAMWGFYLAVEGLEKSFLKRNYGSNYGNLYKPESSAELKYLVMSPAVTYSFAMKMIPKPSISGFGDQNIQNSLDNPK